jgi:hypothetical protein
MENPYDRIHEGMQVVDLAGETIGTVARIHGERPDVDVAGDTDPIGRNMEAKRAGEGAEGYLEVRRANHDLYVPFSAVNEVRGDRVAFIVDRESVDMQGWDRLPRPV